MFSYCVFLLKMDPLKYNDVSNIYWRWKKNFFKFVDPPNILWKSRISSNYIDVMKELYDIVFFSVKTIRSMTWFSFEYRLTPRFYSKLLCLYEICTFCPIWVKILWAKTRKIFPIVSFAPFHFFQRKWGKRWVPYTVSFF